MPKDVAVSSHAKEIGDRIKKARNELGGLKQQELADLLHVSQRAMQSYESGEVIPYRKMGDLAAILEVTQTWLLHGDEAGLEGVEFRHQMERLIETNLQILEEIRALHAAK